MDERPAPEAASNAVDATRALGADLVALLLGDGQNVVFSPASLTLALAMVLDGARARTAEQMAAVLRLRERDSLGASANALAAALARRTRTVDGPWAEPREVVLAVANSLWAQRGYPFEARYLDAITRQHGAGLQEVDYTASADEARRAINAWVLEATHERIPELLARGAVDATTRLVVVNAVYLRAAWATPFSATATRDEPFTTARGAVVDVPMMHVLDHLVYTAGPGWQAVELPYIGGELSMLVVLPNDGLGLEVATAALASSARFESTPPARRTRVRLSLPRFDIETSFDAGAVLAGLGMPDLFDPLLADLTGIAAVPDDPLFVSGVIHQANITVDEHGTEAAAATAAMMAGGTRAEPDPPLELRVDRPFAFAVRDNPTGALLFLGWITDPSRTR